MPTIGYQRLFSNLTDTGLEIDPFVLNKFQAPYTVSYVNYGFGRIPLGGYKHPSFVDIASDLASQNPVATVAPTPLAKHAVINFDTIGQTIYRFVGHVRVPLRVIWAKGVVESGDESVSDTQTFAAALGMPLDPTEEGEIFSLWDANTQILNDSGIVTPIGWSDADAALLALSLANIAIYPGDEAQQPDPTITADKGADKTNAFRGLRYIVFPDYPIQGGGSGGAGGSSGGIPQMSAGFRRTSSGDSEEEGTAVDFLAGSL